MLEGENKFLKCPLEEISSFITSGYRSASTHLGVNFPLSDYLKRTLLLLS
jgi:hypothetical protein